MLDYRCVNMVYLTVDVSFVWRLLLWLVQSLAGRPARSQQIWWHGQDKLLAKYISESV